jgi:hypothetical protein
MPNTPVKVRRWQIVASFVILVVVFTLLLLKVQSTSDTAKHAAHDAAAAAHANAMAIQRADAIRVALVAKIHAADVRSCTQRHVLYVVLRDTVRRGLAANVALAKTPTIRADRKLLAQVLRSQRSNRRLLIDLGRANCTHVPPLSHPPKLRAVPPKKKGPNERR